MNVSLKSTGSEVLKKAETVSDKRRSLLAVRSNYRIQKEAGGSVDRQPERRECDISIWAYIIHGNALKAAHTRSRGRAGGRRRAGGVRAGAGGRA